MGCVIRKNHKVADLIVVFISVDMVNYFLGEQKPSYIFFHNQSMLPDITSPVLKWMIE